MNNVSLLLFINILFVSSFCYASSYNYDSLNRLTSATIDGSYVEYVYDNAGNILEVNTPYTISTTVLGAGTVTDDRGKINCGDDCIGVYENNTSVTLTATPDNGYSFIGWSGSGCSGTSTCTINVTVQHTVTATFSSATNNPPEFTSFGPYSIDENSPNGSFVGDVDANDGDGGSNDADLSYSIIGGTGQSVFSINNSGIVSVADSNQLDYETTQSFSLQVDAYDGVHHTSQNVTINVNDLAEITAPVITYPANGSTINTTTPVVQGTGLANATVTVTGPQQQSCSVQVNAGGDWSCSLSSDLQAGINTLYASQQDPNGATSPVTSTTFTIEGVISLPAPVITSPQNNAYIVGTNLSLAGTSEPGEYLKVAVYSGASWVGDYCEAQYNTGTWSCDINSLSYGTYTINAFHYENNSGSQNPISPSDSIIVNLIDSANDLIFENSFEPLYVVRNLNDTGIIWGANSSSGNNSTCTSDFPEEQDCNQGRDASNNDDSDGHAGFSFTKLDSSGLPLPDQSVDYAALPWACVRDNVTGLVWEVKTDDGGIHDKDTTYRWGGITHQGNYGTEFYDDWDELVNGSNNESLCGYNDWRVPITQELISIVDISRYNPSIDINYFPNTNSSVYWMASPYSNIDRARASNFSKGTSHSYSRSSNLYVRLVR